MTESTMNAALRQFEAVEANLVKAERLLDAINEAIPQGIVFGSNPDYESNCYHFDAVYAALPKIRGWKPDIHLMELDEIAQNRLDAEEVGEIECKISVGRSIEEPSRTLRQYRMQFDQMRRELVRDALQELISGVDECIQVLSHLPETTERHLEVEHQQFEELKQNVAQINMLMGSSISKPPRWSDLGRHIRFGLYGDLQDIILHDWPAARAGLQKSMYGDNEPMPVGIEDLETLIGAKPRGSVATKLRWDNLTEEQFERLIFALVATEPGYENAAWLTKTEAPDRGRDVSVFRVQTDTLGGTTRQRVIIQCKHWLSKSVGIAEIATLREQMKTWEPPRVDVHVIATSGRFTSDAILSVEKHNHSDSALRIEMWPESHLELLLAARPSLIAEFSLR
ncbi:restriction endonuclease [Paraburkholderia fynbosensis]|uniref:Restriction endonuclease type IV Mrr domain-containing protein n=1 Tax=Paraburkholderia fynbosensis TaxID=1200993 RepID=A0A6J5FIB7_9BURK|nr:restriction endonuclease [Paraburkholderia fynbosensis]CAB3780377.1 hypothetical protein LMG27177_00906 [Paraburkholderia fynbosensis]